MVPFSGSLPAARAQRSIGSPRYRLCANGATRLCTCITYSLRGRHAGSSLLAEGVRPRGSVRTVRSRISIVIVMDGEQYVRTDRNHLHGRAVAAEGRKGMQRNASAVDHWHDHGCAQLVTGAGLAIANDRNVRTRQRSRHGAARRCAGGDSDSIVDAASPLTQMRTAHTRELPRTDGLRAIRVRMMCRRRLSQGPPACTTE
ncbi:hypothetical protein C2E23DRAFT_848517 [Lenzites betulinus]|nr:hypothetical protein C2E23DRAFT_848517 [Lenzites betulinus]